MIEHLLCTHCTFGTSALENASAEAASRVLGYSVRASSIQDRTRLREEFRAIERLLSYDLPSDATAEHKKRLDALTSPLRLLHVPDIAGRQVVGQVAFRQFDTSNRPGSYFAHLLVGPAATPWPALDALRLCGLNDSAGKRGWCHTDRDEGFPDLAGMSSLETWLAGDKTWLTDRLVREFLRTGKVLVPEAYGKMLSDRWGADTTPQQRLALLTVVAQAILDRESVPSIVLAVEPFIAAVLFYGALRILPAVCHRAVGFSTYEPDPFRTTYRLVATVFVNDATDFRPEAYQGDSLVVNTFRKPFSTGSKRPTPGTWVDWATERFMADKSEELDNIAAGVGQVWTKGSPTSAELDEIPHLEKFRRDLFQTNQPGSLGRRLTSGHHQYLALRCSDTIRRNREALGRLPKEKSLPLVRNLQKVFATTPDAWRRLLKDPVIQAWVNQAQPTDESGVQRQLLQSAALFPDSDAALLVLSSDCVVRERRLPTPTPNTRRLWGEWSSPATAAAYRPPDLLLKVLGQMPPNGLTRLLPLPIPPLAVVRALALTLAQHLQPTIGTSATANATAALRMHLRQILDEAAGDRTAVAGRDCLEPGDFEGLLETAADCRDHYDPSPGHFGDRVADLIRGFSHRPQDVCKSPRLINLGLQWAGCSSDHEELTRQLRAWKKMLSWFAIHAESNKIPFAGCWTPNKDLTRSGPPNRELMAVIEDMVPDAVSDTKRLRLDVMKKISAALTSQGWLKSTKHSRRLDDLIAWLFQ